MRNDHIANKVIVNHGGIYTKDFYGLVTLVHRLTHQSNESEHPIYNFHLRCCSENGYEAITYSK